MKVKRLVLNPPRLEVVSLVHANTCEVSVQDVDYRRYNEHY